MINSGHDNTNPIPGDKLFSAGYLAVVREFFVENGWPLEGLGQQIDISEERIKDASSYVNEQELLLLIDYSKDFNVQPGMGFELGKRINLHSHGTLVHGVLGSETYFDGLLLMSEFVQTRTQLIQFEGHNDTEYFNLRFKTAYPFGELESFVIECVFAAMNTMITNLLGPNNIIEDFYFASPPPENIEQYQAELGQRLHFNADHHGIRVRLDELLISSQAANEGIVAIVRKQCEEQLNQLNDSLSTMQLLSLRLQQEVHKNPSQQQMAESLNVSSRTLRRYLEAENTSYQEVVLEVKKEKACDLLSRNERSIDEIAQSVGYSETTNFSRAFKRWTGLTPAEYREQQ